MAIIIEEDKKKNGGALAMLGWIVILLIVVVGLYYIFLAPAPTAVVPPPITYTQLQPLGQISVLPQDVTNLTSFQALHGNIAPVATGSAVTGRPNPFIAP